MRGKPRCPRNSTKFPQSQLWPRFPFTLQQTPCKMVVTAVRGHLLELDFIEQYKVWKAHNPAVLFQAPIQRKAPQEDLARMLRELARQCQWLVLWLDCDREGEAIAFEVVETCQQAAGGRLQVFRAVFSALTHADLTAACRSLRAPDRRLADAVEARQMFDLRAGSAFTRWMSLRYQPMFPELAGETLSYGPCQFPTLGFVVERFLRIQRFVPEPFWAIKAEIQKQGRAIPFAWRRGRLFDRLAVLALFELVVEESPNGAVVVSWTQSRQAYDLATSFFETLVDSDCIAKSSCWKHAETLVDIGNYWDILGTMIDNNHFGWMFS